MAKKVSQQTQDALDRLEVEKDIASVVKRGNASFKELSAKRKELLEIDKEILDYQKRIAILAEDKTAEGKKQLAIAEQELVKRQELSSEIKKQLSLGKALINGVGTKMLGILSQQSDILKNSLGMYYDIDDAVRKTSMSLGLSSARMGDLSQKSQNVANHFASIGLSSTAAVEMQQVYSDEVGRTVMLSEQAMINMGELARKTGMGAGEMAGMVGQMEAFGFGSVTAMKNIEEIRDTAQGMGINSGKVLKKVQQNMNLLNKLNFKGGVKGLGKMASYAEKFKIDMGALAESARAVWSPEGAIEAAASLQTLGGGFSKLADPFKLMFDARNDPEKYAKSITDSLEGIAKLNGDEFTISTYELQRLDEAGKALGFSGEQMAEMAKQKAKMDKVGGSLNMFSDPKDRELLAGMVEFKDGQAMIEGESLREMSDERKKELLATVKSREQNAKDAMATREMWTNIMNQVQSTFLPLMQMFDKSVRPYVESLSEFIKNWPVTTAVIAGLGMVVGKVAEWYTKGYHLGLGFNAATKGIWASLKDGVKKLNPKNWFKRGGGGSAMSDQSTVQNEVTDPAKKATKGGGGVGKSLKSLASGLGAMGTPQVLFGALNLIPTSIGMIAMLPALPTLAFLGNVPMKGLYKNLSALGRGLTMMGSPTALLGTVTLIAAALGFTLMTAGAIGLAAIALGGEAAGAGLIALAGGLNMLGGSFAVAGLGVVILLGLGAAMMMMGAAVYFVASGIALIVDSFTNMFSVINGDNIGALLLLGPALMGISLGVMMLGGSLLMLAASMALGGWLGLLALGTAAESVGTAFSGIDGDGITKSVEAINNVDLDKIQALKELSMAMSLWGLLGAKPIVVKMDVGGQISLGGPGGESFDVSELSQQQISELKDLLFQKQQVDSTGGYA